MLLGSRILSILSYSPTHKTPIHLSCLKKDLSIRIVIKWLDGTISNFSLKVFKQTQNQESMMLQAFFLVGIMDTTKNKTGTALPFSELVLRATFGRARKQKRYKRKESLRKLLRKRMRSEGKRQDASELWLASDSFIQVVLGTQ